MNRTLTHHGILGQKWGIRRFQPYPSGEHKGKFVGEKTEKKSDSGDEEQSGRKGLTDGQKRAIKIGAAAVGVALLAYGGYRLYKDGKFDSVIDKFSKKGENSVSDILGTDVKSASTNTTVKYDPNFTLTSDNAIECSKGVNPTHSATNCGSTSTATLANAMGGNYQALPEVPEHMRRVLSNGKLGHGYDPEKLISCYDGGKWDHIDPQPKTLGNLRKALRDNLESQPDGAKGIMYFDQLKGRDSGHYFTWVKIDGKVHVLEGQASNATGIDWTGDALNKNVIDKLVTGGNADNTAHVARLDNCAILPGREKDLFMPRENSK